MFGLVWIFNRLQDVIAIIYQSYNSCKSRTPKFGKFFFAWGDNLVHSLNQVSELNSNHKRSSCV